MAWFFDEALFEFYITLVILVIDCGCTPFKTFRMRNISVRIVGNILFSDQKQ